MRRASRPRIYAGLCLRALASAQAFVGLCSGTATAFDCKLAKSPPEKALCADPAAKAADDAMSAAFAQVRRTADSRQGAALLANQRHWLASRNASCTGESAPAACLRREDEARTQALTARPLAGPGTPDPLVPAVVARAGTKTAYAVDLFLYRFPSPKTPAETALNAAIDKIIADAPTATDDASGSLSYSYSGTASIAYASDKLLSLAIEMFEFSGGAHGNSTNQNITIDMVTGRLLGLDDLVAKSKQAEVGKLCSPQLASQLKQKLVQDGQDPDKDAEAKASLKELTDGAADGIGSVTSQLANWAFHEHDATIDFSPDEIAPHALGGFTCTLPFERLRPLIKPGAPLPG